ncbi:MAG: CinA family protein, partial [Actinomycetota bacterium]
ESAAGGLISSALLSVPGASAYYLGGTVVYTIAASKALLAGAVEAPKGLRGATEEFARYQAQAIRGRLGTTWGTGETGATGPTPNRYGDPAGHGWLAIAGPLAGGNEDTTYVTRHVLTGLEDRVANMAVFAAGALRLFLETLEATSKT